MHILLNLIGVTIVFGCFDLWMSKGDVDTFALVIKFGNVNAIVGLFEANGKNWPFAWCNNCNIFLKNLG
jgi:hypothetical protein